MLFLTVFMGEISVSFTHGYDISLRPVKSLYLSMNYLDLGYAGISILHETQVFLSD